MLIKQGARLVQDWNDVVAELPPESRRHLIDRSRDRMQPRDRASQDGDQASLLNGSHPDGAGGGVDSGLGPVARRVLASLPVDVAVHLDDLLEKMEDISPSELIASLFELEMMGVARQLPGKNFVKVW